jgi:acyl dehydratase/NAD(P)-dependent dehydrogenase (short-subunit alcohol dehydrogenase family)
VATTEPYRRTAAAGSSVDFVQFEPIEDVDAIDAIDEATHAAFVALTGDRNPLHVDALAARRLQFGERAVHGVHLVMRALATLDSVADLAGLRCSRVRTRFLHSVPVGGGLRVEVDAAGEREWVVRLLHDVWIAAEVRVWMEAGEPEPTLGSPRQWPADRVPVDRTNEALEGAVVEVPLVVVDEPEGPFSDITADLLTLTRLVGMEMPGLHSLFSQFDISRTNAGAGIDALSSTVTEFDDRFGKITMHVIGATLGGTVTAFVRPAPTSQPSPDEWSAHPAATEFAGQRALVVGGTRGLGEVTAGLLAAGGAQVTVTYRHGAADAQRVVDALAGDGHAVIELDVSNRQQVGALRTAVPGVTHLYYFASPPIFRGVNGVYSNALFNEFRSVYVAAFDAVVGALDPAGLIGVLLPSSVAVDRVVGGMAEYADAKRLAEARADELAAEHPHLSVIRPRFPRLDTDQTASLLPAETGDAVAELLPALRSMAEPHPG